MLRFIVQEEGSNVLRRVDINDPDSFREVLLHLERLFGFQIIVYDPDDDTVVFGGDHLDEIAEREGIEA